MLALQGLLTQRCPKHPLLASNSPCNEADMELLREAYICTALCSRFVCGRPAHHIHIPSGLFGGGTGNLPQAQEHMVLLSSFGRVISVIGGVLRVTTISPSGDWVQQVPPTVHDLHDSLHHASDNLPNSITHRFRKCTDDAFPTDRPPGWAGELRSTSAARGRNK